MSAMSTAGIVTMFLGAFIVCLRGPLLFVPEATLQWFGEAIKIKRRTRVYGIFVILITVPMIWSGMIPYAKVWWNHHRDHAFDWEDQKLPGYVA